MFILKDILGPLEKVFSSTNLGRDRGRWFAYTIFGFHHPFYHFHLFKRFFAASIPFSASMSTNVDFTLLWHPIKSHGINCGRLCGT